MFIDQPRRGRPTLKPWKNTSNNWKPMPIRQGGYHLLTTHTPLEKGSWIFSNSAHTRANESLTTSTTSQGVMSFFLLSFCWAQQPFWGPSSFMIEGSPGKGPGSLMFLQPRLGSLAESVGAHPPSLAALPCLDSFGHGSRPCFANDQQMELDADEQVHHCLLVDMSASMQREGA